MYIDDELIRKFFNRQCNAEEARLVAEWLQEHPDQAAQYYNEQEWMAEPVTCISDESWEPVWQELNKRRSRVIRMRRLAYAAAAGISALLLYMWLLKPERMQQHTELARTVIPEDSIVIKNDGDTSRKALLADGTEIALQPGAAVRYSKTTWQKERAIQAEGMVTFRVAKEYARPFIVCIDSVAVQALGTVFSVSSGATHTEVKVRLFEGKVSVNALAAGAGRKGNVLLPGQEAIVSLKTWQTRLHYFIHSQDKALLTRRQPHTGKILRPSGWFEFTNQSVGEVFQALEVLYGARIQYTPEEVRNLFFIGRFEPGDSLDMILETIALLNKLQLEKHTGNHYTIRSH